VKQAGGADLRVWVRGCEPQTYKLGLRYPVVNHGVPCAPGSDLRLQIQDLKDAAAGDLRLQIPDLKGAAPGDLRLGVK
jgi:hypothetical protein